MPKDIQCFCLGIKTDMGFYKISYCIRLRKIKET